MMFGTPGRVKNCINAKDEDESKDRTYLSQAIDVIFLSPPWGGVDYGKVGGNGYDLTWIKIDADDGIQGDGEWRLEQAIKEVENKGIAYSLLNGLQLAKSAQRAGCKGPNVLEQNVQTENSQQQPRTLIWLGRLGNGKVLVLVLATSVCVF